jgi:hypothetical protein
VKKRRTSTLKATAFGLVLSAGIAAIIGSGGGGDVIPPFWSPAGIVVDDFDADGRVDVAVAASYIAGPPPHPGYIRVYRQGTDGSYGGPVDYRIGPDPWGLSAGDIDGDGWTDLIAATPLAVAPENNVINDSGEISILRQDGANPGTFLGSQRVFTGGAANDAAIGQLSGDALADIVVADGVAINGRALLLKQDPALPGSFLSPVSLLLGAGHGSDDLAIGDVDGDGRDDIVLAAYDIVAVFYQNASGGFDPVQQLSAGKRVSGVALADLDGDTRTDIVVANAGNAPDGSLGESTVTILLQLAAGNFTASNIAIADGARRVAIADLNDDTFPDVAVISIVFQSQQPSRVSVLLQSATTPGQFAVSGVYDGPFLGTFIATGDINNDTLNDIVVNDGPVVLLQRASAKGTFEPVQSLP